MSIQTPGVIWKNTRLKEEKNLMLIAVLTLMLLSSAFANSSEEDSAGFDDAFPVYESTPTTPTTPTTSTPTISTTTTSTTTTTTTRTTTTTAKPEAPIQQCGLRKNKICVKRTECSTSRSNNPKIVIDLKVPPLSGCHYLEACCYPKDKLSPSNTSLSLRYRQCGVSNVGGIFMTVKGNDLETGFSEYPWTVAILDANQQLLCSGALISYKAVLTTATCLAPEQPLMVWAGDWDLRTDKEPVPHETRAVRKRIIHEQFTWESAEYNIALLILEKKLPAVKHIIPVCWDKGSTDLDFDNCHASGWHVRPPSGVVPTREIVLKIDMDMAKPSHGSNSTPKEFRATARTQRPVSARGAPLVCPTEDNKYYLVGAWSTSMNGDTYFANVTQYSNWIRDKLVEIHNKNI